MSFSFESKSIPRELEIAAGVSVNLLISLFGLSVSCLRPFVDPSIYGFEVEDPLFYFCPRFGVDAKLLFIEFSFKAFFS